MRMSIKEFRVLTDKRGNCMNIQKCETCPFEHIMDKVIEKNTGLNAEKNFRDCFSNAQKELVIDEVLNNE